MDRIDLGLDSMEEEPIPFFTPPRELTLEEYKADSNINFYNTVLGLPSLAAAPKKCKIGKIKFKENDTLSVDQVIMEFAFN